MISAIRVIRCDEVLQHAPPQAVGYIQGYLGYIQGVFRDIQYIQGYLGIFRVI